MRRTILIRCAAGLVTLLVVSMIVFAATSVLPGNAANAILGQGATPERVKALDVQLHLNQSVPAQYWAWLSHLVIGNPGTSLTNGTSVLSLVGPRLANSGVLVLLAGVIGSIIGVAGGVLTAVRRDGVVSQIVGVSSLVVIALPEFVIAIILIILFASIVLHLLPAVSLVPPGSYAWDDPKLLILPVTTLVIVIVPYILRMTRAATIEALESDYVEMARLKGTPMRRIVLAHALRNALAPIAQVIGLSFLYLAGGIVVVEYVFAFPGIGQGLVNAVNDRDVTTVQFIVVVMAAFYVIVNITADMVSLVASPRRRSAL